jgi:hypothetical protein
VLIYFLGSFGFRRIEATSKRMFEDRCPCELDRHSTGLHKLKPGFEYQLEGIAGAKQRPDLNENLNVVFDHLGEPLAKNSPAKSSCHGRRRFNLCVWSRSIWRLSSPESHPRRAANPQAVAAFAHPAIPVPQKWKTAIRGEEMATSEEMARGCEARVCGGRRGLWIYHLFCEPPHVFPTDGDCDRTRRTRGKWRR